MAIQDDLIALFKLLPGGMSTANAATAKFEQFKLLIQTEARKGAEAAIPEIEMKIKAPIIAAIGLSALSLLVSFAMVRRSRRALSGPSYRRLGR